MKNKEGCARAEGSFEEIGRVSDPRFELWVMVSSTWSIMNMSDISQQSRTLDRRKCENYIV